ncbi:methoxymalonyl-ACP biosynthesis protein FkbH [Synergistales bacterium]|nr:methoxymalonyl-ACP biosynthesis protein FkbH [Synergistales bacterium]
MPHDLLKIPFDPNIILTKRKSIKRQLLENQSASSFLEKRVAILGGSTTRDIMEVLELFLLNYGIKPTFYESEYGQYWQDVMFDSPSLLSFAPDLAFVHTSNRNIERYPEPDDEASKIDELLDMETQKFQKFWDKLHVAYGCAVIQNNFEYPFYRLMGNKDASDVHGRVNFITRLNMKFYEYAQTHGNFYINDINYISSSYGLEAWADPFYWYMYKYSLCLPAIPLLAHNISNITKSIYGLNKKVLALDLDNTLWGGVVGDDGVNGIAVGQETSEGQAYREFQEYIKHNARLGVLLTVNSKNDRVNAIAGLNHPDGALRPEDFALIKANWEPKSLNIVETAKELSLLPDSFVFADDNPAERAIVEEQVPGVAVPVMDRPERYIQTLDKFGFFEVTNLSKDDLKRGAMYKENEARGALMASFENYRDYLLSLEMKATIRAFEPVYMSRIAQLTNKSNQFNLTTKRYTQSEIEAVSGDDKFVTLYGKLEDKFGDNGVVSVVIGRIDGSLLHVELWLMSCRVLKRDMEYAMMDELVKRCGSLGITKILGYYYRTAKNAMVEDFYDKMKFTKQSEDSGGDSAWVLEIDSYKAKNTVIDVGD